MGVACPKCGNDLRVRIGECWIVVPSFPVICRHG